MNNYIARSWDRTGMTVSGAAGTGDVTLGSAITDSVNGDLLTFTQAGAIDQDFVSVLFVDGNNWEIGLYTYDAVNQKIKFRSAGVIWAKNAGTVQFTPISLSASAKVYSIQNADSGFGIVGEWINFNQDGSIVLTNNPQNVSATRFVATNAYYNDSFNAGVKSQQSRSRHFARSTTSTVQLIFGNFNSVGEGAPGATWTIKASIEYPPGATPVAVLFSGSTTGTGANGGIITSDALTITIRDGDEFFVRSLVNCSAGIAQCTGVDTANGETVEQSGTINALTDKTTSGVITANGGATFRPWGIVGPTTKEAIIIFGDSRAAATNDSSIAGQAPDFGIIGRSLGQFYAYANMAVGGETTAQFIAGHTNRNTLAQYATQVVFAHGIADFIGGVTLASTILTNLTTIAGYSNITGKHKTGVTLEPVTTSTDGWTSYTQTQTSWEAQRVIFNNTIRGIGAAQPAWMNNGYLELADASESKRDSGLWKILGGPSRNFTYTVDGIHSSPFGIRNARYQDAVNLGLFGPGITVARGSMPIAALSPAAQEFASFDGTIDPAQLPSQLQLGPDIAPGLVDTPAMPTILSSGKGTGNASNTGNILFKYAPYEFGHSVTAMTGTASPYTITFAAGTGVQQNYPVGSIMRLTGATPSTLNGDYTVTASSTGQVTATTTQTGTWTSGGTIGGKNSQNPTGTIAQIGLIPHAIFTLVQGLSITAAGGWSTGQTVGFTFGDSFSAFAAAYGGKLQIGSYWGVQIMNTQGGASSVSMLDFDTATSTITVGVGMSFKPAAGTTTVAPIKLTSGTNMTTATAGVLEYDGSVFYGTPGTIGRGVLETEQWAVSNTDKTLTSTTTAQAAFNTTTNGAITVGIGTYEFECMLDLASMSATSGSFGFALAGTATKTQFWNSEANKVATLATASSAQNTYNTTNANTALATANVNTLGYALLKGVIRVTVAGTIIPQVSLGVAAAAVVKAGSYFRIKQLSGSATFLSVGNWS